MLDTKLQSEEYKFYFLFFLALTFLFSMLMPISFGDLGVWIAEGRQILEQGTIYIHDAYSFNPTDSTPFPWLSSLFYHFLDSNFAIDSIFILHRLIPVAIVAYWLIRYPAIMHKNSIISLMICISGIRMLIVDRPALLVLPLIPYFYELIDSHKIYRRKIKSLFLLILWTNLHGSFALFFLMLGYKTAVDIIKNRKRALTKEKVLFFVTAFAATCVNPWGLKIYNYVLQTASVSKVRISEWQPLSLYENGQVSFEFIFFALTIVLLIALVFYKKKLKELLSSPLPVFIITSFLAVRNLPLFFAVFPLFWGKHLVNHINVYGFAPKAPVAKVIFHRTIVTLIVLFGIYMFTDYSESIRPLLSKKYAHRYDETSSLRIAEYLNNSKGKRIFNDWILGSYFIYSQSNQIFIDTRNIIYNDAIYSDYVKTVENKDGQSETLLNQYQIDYVVSEKANPLTKVLQTSASWNFIMEDNGYSLFEKK